MSTEFWSVFPYPVLSEGKITDGSTMVAHEDCVRCPTFSCVSDKSVVGDVRQCRFGLTYVRLDDERLALGMVATPTEGSQTPKQRRRHGERERHARPDHIARAVETVRAIGPGAVLDFEKNRDALLAALSNDATLHKAVAETLRKNFDSNLAQSHDFLQLVKIVQSRAEALLNKEHPTLSAQDAADQEPALGAIYYSTSLMNAKLDALVYLNEINQIFGNEKFFRLHSLVLQYVRIYLWQARQKDVSIILEGESYATCYYDGNAIGAVVQGILDNLVKYAPAGSRARIKFSESRGSVQVEFVSLGPQIQPSEVQKIFLPGYRADAARGSNSDGQGIGLATAKTVSDALHLQLVVSQSELENPNHPNTFETSFALNFAIDH